ncbi:MAG: hypothetical protein ACR2FV_07715 [Ornithinimicrobium sp.]|uniref:hypothetical protein n=1 Tax=Ornithinimicrobium sp. TaxID=1977084 RepID=UPI003D9B32C1
MTQRVRISLCAGLGALVLVTGCAGPDEGSSPEGDDAAPAATSSASSGDVAAPTTPGTGGEDARATSSAPDDAATSTAQQQVTSVTSTDGAFTFDTPQAWSDVTSEAGAQSVAAVRADERADDFFTNLVVVAEEPIADLEQSIEEAKTTIAGADGAATATEQIEVDGETGYAFRISRTVQDVDIVQAQRWVEHDGALYVLTMSSARTQQRSAVDTLEEILQSWSWQ